MIMKLRIDLLFQAAYSFYNVSTATSWTDLMGDALVLARKEGFDVFNALDLMENRYMVNEISNLLISLSQFFQ